MTTNQFIRRLEQDLGQRIEPLTTPRQFHDLPGTTAKDCLLPSFTAEYEYHLRYGSHFLEDEANLRALEEGLLQAEQVIQMFHEFARDNVGQDVLDAARVTLRRLWRIEQKMEPLFAGLSMSTFGRVKSMCIAARANVGDILDQKAMAGEL